MLWSAGYLLAVSDGILEGDSLHRLPARRQLVNGRQRHVPMDCQGQSAGNGGGGHGQQVGQGVVFALQLGPLLNTKPAAQQAFIPFDSMFPAQSVPDCRMLGVASNGQQVRQLALKLDRSLLCSFSPTSVHSRSERL